jgi:hypothetical protein
MNLHVDILLRCEAPSGEQVVTSCAASPSPLRLERMPVMLNHLSGSHGRACPGLSRPSTSFCLKARKKDVDARDWRGRDGGGETRSKQLAPSLPLGEVLLYLGVHGKPYGRLPKTYGCCGRINFPISG